MHIGTGKTVYVGLSGGVDSSVAALRLLKQGYTVVGVFIKVWHPDFLECNWEQERLDAMRVAAKLGIPFLTCDAQDAYKEDVANYFINEYKEGKTPNPDVMCNKYVKFGAFLDFALQNGADYIATGHYAQVIDNNGMRELHRGVDTNKDQSYFLWTLTQKELSKVLLPVGNSTKDVIREEAKKAGLLTASKKDSQGICFLGHVDIAEFLSHYTTITPGNVLDEQGEVIGKHQGALVYTTGQRHGFIIHSTEANTEPRYVIARDMDNNTITVSHKHPQITPQETIVLQHCNFINETSKSSDTLEIQTRYRQKPSTVIVQKQNEHELELMFTVTSEEVSSGQSCVLYDGMRCVGGGIIA